MNDQFARPWNVKGRTWITVDTPGPWAVENSWPLSTWRIINTETGRTKEVGPCSRPGRSSKINYFDRAVELAVQRNREGTQRHAGN